MQINRDSSEGFTSAAEHVGDDRIASYFRQCAHDRTRFASELATFVEASGGDAPTSGTVRGTLHRWWLDLRGSVQGGDLKAMLSEAERGEDAIKAKYEHVLKDTAGSAMNDVLTRQYASVKQTHDRVRDLRDAM